MTCLQPIRRLLTVHRLWLSLALLPGVVVARGAGPAGSAKGSVGALGEGLIVFSGPCAYLDPHRAPQADADGDGVPDSRDFDIAPTGLGGLPSVLLPSLISNTLSRFSAAVKHAGEARVTTVSGLANIDLAVDPPPECLLVVRGGLRAADVVDIERNLRAKKQRLVVRTINAADPDLVAELIVRPSRDRTALSIAPTYLRYRRLLEEKQDAGERLLALQVTFFAAGSKPDATDAVGSTLVLGKMSAPVEVNLPDGPPDGPWPLETGWFPTFVPAASEKTPKKAWSVQVSAAETREPRKFLLFLADVLQGSETGLQLELEKLLIDQKREAAELEEFKKRVAALGALQQALLAEHGARQAWCATPNDASPESARLRLTASVALYKARLDANVAARAADRPEPFSGPADPSDSADKTGCQ